MTDYPWPVHPAADRLPLLDDEAGDVGYRTRRTDGLPLCEITPSTLRGYWYVTKFEFPARDVVGLRRPVKASGVPEYLRHFEVPPDSAWAPFPTKPRSEAPWFESACTATGQDRDVYLIQPVSGGLIKIGSACNVTSRLGDIQRMSPSH